MGNFSKNESSGEQRKILFPVWNTPTVCFAFNEFVIVLIKYVGMGVSQ